MNNNRINIIKYIEEQENKDIWDYQKIVIILDGEKYSHKPLYLFEWSNFETTRYRSDFDAMIDNCDEDDRTYECIYVEYIHKKQIKNKSQIANRIQYIKQSGYKFSCYNVVENSLTIVFV